MQLKTQLEQTEAVLEDEQMQRQKLTAEFEEVKSCLGALSHHLCWGWWRFLPFGLLLCSWSPASCPQAGTVVPSFWVPFHPKWAN